MVEVRPAVASDAPAIGTMLGEAFGDDPAWALFFPDGASRPAHLAAHYRHYVRRHPDRVDVAVEDGQTLGALLWEPPRRDAGRWARWGTRVAAALRLLVSPTARRGRAHTRAVEAHRPSEPHWYFHDIATGPRARGKGIGSALLRHRLDIIDRGVPGSPSLDFRLFFDVLLLVFFGASDKDVEKFQPGPFSFSLLDLLPRSDWS